MPPGPPHVLDSTVPGAVWPALPTAANAYLLALMFQLSESQWWAAEDLERHQFRQAADLLVHAARQVPFYRERLDAMPKEGLDAEAWRRLPLLHRADVQAHMLELSSTVLPKEHGRKSVVQTSGSTGRPVTVRTTGLTRLFFQALNLRYHIWFGRDFLAKAARITRPLQAGTAPPPGRWIPGFRSGPMVSFDVTRPIPEQLDWLRAEGPKYLLTYPSNLEALLRHCAEAGETLESLGDVSAMGEVLDPELRDVCREVWGVPLTDSYSTQELGLLAIQCPERPHYHVQAENAIVEILDDDGAPCPPGQVGRIVVTDLHNYAMPLIRYEVGDYGAFGPSCSCGRGLPVLERIVGRSRNMLKLPDGGTFWPSFPSELFTGIAPVRQFQLVQRALDEIELRLVVAEPLDEDREARLRAALGARLGPGFKLPIVYVDEIPRSASGKFEDFLCEV